MRMTWWLRLCLVVLIGLPLVASTGSSQTMSNDPRLPSSVKKTFNETFPNGEIFKVDVDRENGVTVYDIEFRDGKIEKETDITANGTMLEFTVVINAKSVPTAAMKTIRETAAGGTIKRIERIEINWETKDGKTIKLAKPLTHYAAEIAKGIKSAEVVVTPEGTVVEPAQWGNTDKEKSKGKAGKQVRYRLTSRDSAMNEKIMLLKYI